MNRATAPQPGDGAFRVEVKTHLTNADYAELYAIGQANGGTTVDSLVAECVRRALHGRTPDKNRNLTDADRQRLRELNAAGWNDSRIARELGFVPSAIGGWRRRMGLPRRNPTGRKETA